MELSAEAKAVANLDAVCDEYERALRSDESSRDNDHTSSVGLWLDRVSADLRPWLREELNAIRHELRSTSSSAADQQQAPAGVCAESWNAVTECSTFQFLSHDAKVSLAKRIEPREMDAGALLLRSGARTSGLLLITEGQVQVLGGEGASRHQIDTDGAGSVLGEMSLLTGYPCAADVIATTPVRMLVLPCEAFDSLRAMHPEVEVALSQLVSDRLGHRRHDA